jgi:hypothetical protein
MKVASALNGHCKHCARRNNLPEVVLGLLMRFMMDVRTDCIRSALQAVWALRKRYTTAGVVKGSHGAAPAAPCVYPLGHRKGLGNSSRSTFALIMVLLKIPGRVSAPTNMQVVPIRSGATVDRMVMPEHLSPASSQACRQSCTDAKLSRLGAGTCMPTARAWGSCTHQKDNGIVPALDD